MIWKQRISFELGDIAKCGCMAVVNAANHELWMGSGVAGALKRAGGSSIELEAVRQGPIAVGESVITGGGNLPALHVIHAAAMAAGDHATPESVAAATASALNLAADKGIVSIAFPALGTGVGGVSFEDCAHAMIGAMRLHAEASAAPEEIRLVLFGQNALDVFQRVYDTLDKRGNPSPQPNRA